MPGRHSMRFRSYPFLCFTPFPSRHYYKINERVTDMPRAAKKLAFEDVTALVAVLGAISAQARKAPLTKPQVAEVTGLPTVRLTASYKILIKKELAEQIDPPAGMPPKGVYLKITTKGKAYCKAYDLLFA